MSDLTLPQHRLLWKISERPRFVRGSSYAVARRLAEVGYVQIVPIPGVGREARITPEGIYKLVGRRSNA